MKRLISALLLISLTLTLVSCFEKDLPKIEKEAIETKKEAPQTKKETESEKEEDETNPSSIELKNKEAVREKYQNENIVSPTPLVGSTWNIPSFRTAEFGIDAMKYLYEENENILISPLSIAMALSLASGGASGSTYNQFERVIARAISLHDMLEFYKDVGDKADDNKYIDLNIANSIWIKDDEKEIKVKESYLEYADKYFDAEVFFEKFDDTTVKKINSWVSDETDGMIDSLIDRLTKENVMCIINALSFDAEWQSIYRDGSIDTEFIFTDSKGVQQKAVGMTSTERKYLESDNAIGFIKNYKGGEYGFAVILPNEGITINEFVSELTSGEFMAFLESERNVKVIAKMPKFSFEYKSELNDMLMAMGITDAFDIKKADFTGIGTTEKENLFISYVLHKTFIQVAEKGTRAAAVTAVMMDNTAAEPIPEEIKYVTLDRPFVFAIIDNSTKLPLFLGTVSSVK